jgi:non-homologous end joining protein Ku
MKYNVTIQAVVTKTYTVDAEDQDQAYQLANERFVLAEEFDINEIYQQETLEIEEAEETA